VILRRQTLNLFAECESDAQITHLAPVGVHDRPRYGNPGR
jgi:hypothetical protein